MAIVNGYTTGAALKLYMDNSATDFATRADVEEAITTASRDLDAWCGRRFYADTAATARTFYPTGPLELSIDDAWSVTSFTIDGVAATLGDYDQLPLNGVVDGIEGWPVTRLAVPRDGTSPTRFYRRCVVTAKWGWTAVPSPVVTACKMLAAEQVKTGDVPMIDEFMQAGSSEMKTVYRLLRVYRTGRRAVPVA